MALCVLLIQGVHGVTLTLALETQDLAITAS